ncbi:RagB/SusD family nutrient uptake outer membrane protein [Flavobacterium sp. ANB]|uniref:RagB/SusD family nutrient uptake outer membrane protein n=1 Tax=unclassified Flavobacterium TaxID=196869 RepID=UPI0012B7AEE8|nr:MULTISPECIES: RagB/SusD family nutrient uptake outer membrane protein [unclassified Flavobacterium]MBF4515143.1 RagB/SusD family nutrient uptake outer membrane protein [Flavobacterium sp. ANB]MTD70055.1 RagB/SusD family nutrient uptake outer membrane protein [Flavobacterium sp. LC2016-13]
MKIKNIVIAGSACFLTLFSCTDINENIYDKYQPDSFYGTPEGADIALASVYAEIPGDFVRNNVPGVGYAGADNGWYDMNCMSSDEQVIPHRNTGDWQQDFARLHKHEWLPSDFIINNTWNWLYKSIFNANLAIQLLEKSNAEASKIAEAKVLRAFFYYLLIDDFGDVPFFTDNDITVDKIPQAKRKDVYDFIVKEITENADMLSITKGGNYYGRFNRWAAYTLLAKVYLNAEVYTGVSKWNECLAACNKVSEGGYTLHSGEKNDASPLGYKYYELFGDVLPDDETILPIYATLDVVSRNIYATRSLYGPHAKNLFGYDGWNGTIVPKDFFLKYDANDIRIKQFLVGEQTGGFNYTLDVASLDNPGAAPQAGVRNVKFYPATPRSGGGASNDFPIFRYADVILMKAECNVRLGNPGAAKPFIDQIRVRAGLNGLAANPTLDDVYNERGFELNWEGHRRQDMIRFDKFLLASEFRPASPAYRKLFPIPTSALDANRGLKQNEGYY